MTFFSASPVSSGRPYRIQAVSDAEPSSLEQFVGDAAFTVEDSGAESLICGVGVRHDDGVRFHEKDVANDGKDVRVWQIEPGAVEGFTATAVSAF